MYCLIIHIYIKGFSRPNFSSYQAEHFAKDIDDANSISSTCRIEENHILTSLLVLINMFTIFMMLLTYDYLKYESLNFIAHAELSAKIVQFSMSNLFCTICRLFINT